MLLTATKLLFPYQRINFWLHARHFSSKMKLFTDDGNISALKILAACNQNKQALDVKNIERKDFVLPGCFKKTQPPVLEISCGKYISNSQVAVNYVFNKVKKEEPSLQSSIDELIEYDIGKIQPVAYPILLSTVTKKKIDVNVLSSLFQELEKRIENKTFLLGSHITAADTVIWGSLFGLLRNTEIKASVAKFEKLLTWFERVSSTEGFKKAVDTIVGSKDNTCFQVFLEHYVPPYIDPHGNKPASTATQKAKTVESPTHEEHTVQLTEEEIKKAMEKWNKGLESLPKPKKHEYPVLPKKGEKNLLVTSALPYVNNVPHLGNIIGCVLSADVYARFCRLRNYNCLYICGTDEYGTATETKAIAEGLTPQQICDKYNKIHSEIYKWFNIEFDYFGRTTGEHHEKIIHEMFWKVYNSGHIVEDSVDQLQCQDCKRFLADRFVEGTCPYCKYNDARGDQCDACGKLINAVELINPRCKQCNGTPEIKTSKHLFLDLEKIEPKLKEWLAASESGSDNWSNNARHITKSWITEGLKPRCITRDLKWGIPVPLEGYKEKVFYVWFDAPLGYLSITNSYTDKWEQWWKDPENVRLVQFMAKDNVPFHSVVFPACLIASEDNYLRLNDLSSVEYLNYENDKFSKSRGLGVFGDQAKDTGIPADIYRFYLLFVRPETSDSAFQWDDLVMKNNSELLNNLGNFVNRALMFLKNNFNCTIPELKLTDEDRVLIAHVDRELNEYVQHLESIKLRDGLKFILNISRHGNQYIQANKPWALFKGNDSERERAGTVIGLASNVSALLCILMKPYMPEISKTLQEQIGLPDERLLIPDMFVQLLPVGHKTGTPAPLFQKLESSVAVELKKRFGGSGESKPAAAGKKAQAKATNTTNATTEPTKIDADPAKIEELKEKVLKQGDIVRELKTSGADKEKINEAVAVLLAAKKDLALATGQDPEPPKGKKKGKKK